MQYLTNKQLKRRLRNLDGLEFTLAVRDWILDGDLREVWDHYTMWVAILAAQAETAAALEAQGALVERPPEMKIWVTVTASATTHRITPEQLTEFHERLPT